MKPRFFTAILLFISAYSPLIVILIIKDFDFEKFIFKNPKTIYILFSVTLVSIILLFVSVLKNEIGNTVIKIDSVKSKSNEFVNYTIPYLLSFFGNDWTNINDIFSLIIFLLTVLIITVRSKMVFVNPVLAIAGFGFYEVEYTYDGKSFQTDVVSKVEPVAGLKYYHRKISNFLSFITKQYES